MGEKEDITFQLLEYNNEQHVSFLYELLGERTEDQNISHKEMPTYDQHTQFVNSNPYVVWFVIYTESEIYNNKKEMAGAFYITKNREFGIAIKRGFQRKGIATKAFKEALALINTPIYANVNPQNEASNAFFTKLGRVIQQTYKIEYYEVEDTVL